jgi:hypothetical protein
MARMVSAPTIAAPDEVRTADALEAALPRDRVTPPDAAPPAHGRARRLGAHAARVALACVGLALVGYLVWSLGTASVAAAFRALSWRLVPVVLVPAAVLKLTDAYGWRALLPHRPPPARALLGALVAGQAVSTLTPTGALGGDGVMVMLLRDRVLRRDAVASLVVAHTTSVASQGAFLVLGLVVAAALGDGSSPLIHVMWWVVLLETIAIAGFVLVQLRGVAARLERLLARVGLSRAHLPAAALHVDASLAAFYRGHRGRLARAFAWHLAGWFVGAVEAAAILYGCGMPVPLATALVIEALGTGISFATFFLPTQIGVDEGGAVATFAALGLDPAAGLALALVRRVREAVWVAIGVALLTARSRRRATPGGR